MVLGLVLKCRKILNSRPLKMFPGSCYLPKPGSNRGDDAHFICEDDQTFGVADGVGGWASMGVDAGEFARQLIYHAECAIKDEPKGAINLMRVLEKAFSNTRAIGGSTACIAALRDEVYYFDSTSTFKIIIWRLSQSVVFFVTVHTCGEHW